MAGQVSCRSRHAVMSTQSYRLVRTTDVGVLMADIVSAVTRQNQRKTIQFVWHAVCGSILRKLFPKGGILEVEDELEHKKRPDRRSGDYIPHRCRFCDCPACGAATKSSRCNNCSATTAAAASPARCWRSAAASPARCWRSAAASPARCWRSAAAPAGAGAPPPPPPGAGAPPP